ncbi:MAG: hypothetical protein ACK5HY_12470 [Parahaliea sp.]
MPRNAARPEHYAQCLQAFRDKACEVLLGEVAKADPDRAPGSPSATAGSGQSKRKPATRGKARPRGINRSS